MELLSTPIEFLKGVGPSRADLLKKELNIFTYKDLLYYFPFRYVDKSRVFNISDLEEDMPFVQIKGEIIRFEDVGKGGQEDCGISRCNRYCSTRWFKGTRWIRIAKIKYRI